MFSHYLNKLNKQKAVYISAISISVLLLMFSAYHFYYANRIIKGVFIGQINVGGLKYDHAKKLLAENETKVTQELTLKYGEKKFVIKAADVDLKYDWDAAVTRAFEIGRTGNIFIDNRDKFVGLFKALYIRSFYTLDDDLFSRALSSIKGEINVLPKDARFIFKDRKIVVDASMSGFEIDGDHLYQTVVKVFDNLGFGEKNLIVDNVSQKIREADIEPLVGDVEKIVANPLTVVFGYRTWRLNQSQLLDLIAAEKDGDKTSLTLNKSNFEAYLDSLSQDVNRLPRGEITGLDGVRVTGFKLISDGTELDIKKFTEDFKDALFNTQPKVEVSMKTIVGAQEDTSKYGIFSLLGEGISKYTGSINARIHNLTLAANRSNGVLVPPKGIYSFNRTIGEVSGATGYDSAYIISGGRTVLGEGGGVCQTSTTLFRAILNAGLPVVQRFPHAYRVRYYEIDSPLGMDASVFQPSLDLQFKNDTPNYILVTSSANLADSSLTFRIYGTPDGRSVELSEPVVSNVIAPPAPLYQDDPTLQKGLTRQIDFSAWGSTVYFTRTVKKGNDVMYKDTFTSRYQPWRAIFLVGSKD